VPSLSRTGDLFDHMGVSLLKGRVRYLLLAPVFATVMYGDDITIPLDNGSIIVENPQFIRSNNFGGKVPGLTFTLTNHTHRAWVSIDLLFDITYSCMGEAHQRSQAVKLGLGWSKDAPIKREFHDLAISLAGQVDSCQTENIKVNLVSATSLDNVRIEGATGGPAALTEQVPPDSLGQPDRQQSEERSTEQAAAHTAQAGAAVANQSKNPTKAARRKQLAAEQQRKQAEADAQAARKKADEERRAAEERNEARGDWLIGGAVLLILLIVVLLASRGNRHGTPHAVASNTSTSRESEAPAPPPVSAPLPSRPISGPAVEFRATQQGRSAEWVGLDSVTVAGFRIPGLVYFGCNLQAIKGYVAEPALIDPSKPVAVSTAGFDPSSIPYWPSYSELEPRARLAYLQWHASGRSAPEAPISFVFLHFYGLERRILRDYSSGADRGEEYRTIIGEVRRLLDIYGGNHSFRRYASALLEMAGAIYQDIGTDAPPPEFPLLGYDLPARLKMGLGVIVRDGKPIPPAWAAAWICADPLFPRRTPFSRCTTYFNELFALRYRELWGAGIVVKPNKTTLRLEYQPASASFGGPVTARTELPDITILKEPIGKLRELGIECTDALDAYSRYLGRNPGADTHPAAMALLPPGLLAESQTGEIRLVRERLSAHVDSAALLSRDELLRLLKAPTEGTFAKRDAVTLAQYLASIGFGMEPDVRFGGPVPGVETKISLFRTALSAAGAPTPAYSAATLIVRMAALVSVADGVAGREEEEHLQNHIAASLHLSEDERKRLSAHLCWVLTEKPSLTGVQSRIESLSATQRQAIGKFLVGVANVDGHVSPNEVNVLGKLYRQLGLAPDDVYSDVHEAATEPVTVESAPAASGFALPPRKAKTKPAGVRLDAAMIETKLQETAAVSALLAAVFVEESPAPAAVMQRVIDTQELIAGLDSGTSAFLRYLSKKPAWSREELEIAAAERSLLLDGSIEAINEVAFDACEQPALEGDNPVEINSQVLSILLERTRTQ
jgi:uncharacterized tellurite resistance protein B-like protein